MDFPIKDMDLDLVEASLSRNHADAGEGLAAHPVLSEPGMEEALNSARASLNAIALRADCEDPRKATPAQKQRASNIALRAATSLGYRVQDGTFYHADMRADSMMEPGSLIETNGAVIWPRRRKLALSALLPTRAVDPFAKAYESHYGYLTGEAKDYDEGSTSSPVVGSGKNTELRRLYGKSTSTVSHWLSAARGRRGASEKMQSDLQAVRRVFARAQEALIVEGLRATSKNAHRESYNWSALADIDALYDAFLTVLNDLDKANKSQGDGPNTVALSPAIAAILQKHTNLGTGGSATGGDVVKRIAVTLTSRGIDRWVIAPSLENFGGSGVDGLVICTIDGQSGLHKVVGHAPAPVRNAQTLHGERTLHYGSFGGPDWSEDATVGIYKITV